MSGILYKPSGNQTRPKLTNIKVELGEYLDYDPGSGHVIAPADSGADVAGGFVLDYEVDNSAGSAGDKKVLLDSGGAVARMQQDLANPSAGGTVSLDSGAGGSVDTITADGVEILEGAVAYNSSLTQTAADVAAQINANNTRFYATSSGDTITVRERVVTKSAWTIVTTITTMGKTDTNASGGEAVEVGNIGSDVYATGKRAVALSGTRAMGTVYGVLDDAGDAVAAEAGWGKVTISGTSGTITQITAGGTNLFASSVAWTTSDENTAILVAAEINLNIGTHGYFAVSDGASVKIYQTTTTLDEDAVALAYTGSDIVTVNKDIQGGKKPRILVKAKAWGN